MALKSLYVSVHDEHQKLRTSALQCLSETTPTKHSPCCLTVIAISNKILTVMPFHCKPKADVSLICCRNIRADHGSSRLMGHNFISQNPRHTRNNRLVASVVVYTPYGNQYSHYYSTHFISGFR